MPLISKMLKPPIFSTNQSKNAYFVRRTVWGLPNGSEGTACTAFCQIFHQMKGRQQIGRQASVQAVLKNEVRDFCTKQQKTLKSSKNFKINFKKF
jgi:hypothetical protein